MQCTPLGEAVTVTEFVTVTGVLVPLDTLKSTATCSGFVAGTVLLIVVVVPSSVAGTLVVVEAAE